MKFLPLALLVSVCFANPILPMAAEPDSLPMEQKLFDDVAARMQEQLHNTTDLLDKIRQSHNPKEREGLILEYHKSMKTTMVIDQLIHQIRDSTSNSEPDKGNMMKGKKMSGGVSCCMKGKKQPAKQTTEESAHGATISSSTDDIQDNNEAPPEDEHEGHH
jgi:hypothetical protein